LGALNIQEESAVQLKPQLAAQDAMYAVSSNIVRDRLAAEGDISALDNLSKHDVVVVKGASDKIEQVLAAIGVPHICIEATELHSVKLNPDQTVYINCHSTYPTGAAENVAAFVKAGGQLITTDHVLHNLLHNAFPGYIKHEGASTPDTSVPITCNEDEKADEVLKGFLGEKEWWLAGGSHPITVENKSKVKVLIAQKGSGAPILVRFEVGEGTVYHMISHFYLQNSKTRDSRSSSITNYQLNNKIAVGQEQQALGSGSSIGLMGKIKNMFTRSNSITASPSSSSSPSFETKSAGEGSLSLGSGSVSVASKWASDRGATKETVEKMANMDEELREAEGVSTMNYQNVQSAATSSEFVMRSVLQQKKKRAQK